MSNKKILSIFIFLILLAGIIFLLKKVNYIDYEKNYFYLDTMINVKLKSNKSSKDIEEIFNEIDYLYSTYNTLADRYNSYDNVVNIYYINEILKDNEEVVLDSKLSTLINEGIKYYEITNGYINIASGNLISVWKDYINKGEGIPTNEELNVNTSISDIKLVGNTLTKTNNVKLDLGAYTKGYVTELVGNYLESLGIKNYIIDAGGNIKTGTPYKKDNYLVGVVNPENTKDIFIKLNINNKSVVTSGDYQRYYEYNGVRYNHIINPYTKYPANNFRSVTVICNDSFKADVYSTYLFLLDLEQGLDIVNKTPDIDAIWYIDSENIIKSDGFNY